MTVVAGLVCIAISRGMAAFIVPHEAAIEAYITWCTNEGRVDDAAGSHYLSLFGYRYLFADLGTNLALGGMTVAGLAFALRLGSDVEGGEPWLRTPRRAWPFFALGIVAVAQWWAAMVWSFGIDLYRLYFPSCADSIGIPIGGITIFAMILTPLLLVIGVLVSMAFGALPVSLWHWDVSRPVRSWIVTMLAAVVILAGSVVTILSLGTSSGACAPAAVIVVYLLAATRAALLAPPRNPSPNVETGGPFPDTTPPQAG